MNEQPVSSDVREVDEEMRRLLSVSVSAVMLTKTCGRLSTHREEGEARRLTGLIMVCAVYVCMEAVVEAVLTLIHGRVCAHIYTHGIRQKLEENKPK